MKLSDLPPKHREHAQAQLANGAKPTIETKKRLRQRAGGPSKLEAEYLAKLMCEQPWVRWRHQAITFKLANGVAYTPDMVGLRHGISLIAIEVKGFMRDDAAVKLKVAAHEYPEIEWLLVWKVKGQWHSQRILP